MRDFSGDFIHMKPLTLILASLVVSSVLTMTAARGPAVDPPTPGLTPKVQAVLDDIRKADSGQLAISAEDGRFLRLLVATNHTKQALEIGAKWAPYRSVGSWYMWRAVLEGRENTAPDI